MPTRGASETACYLLAGFIERVLQILSSFLETLQEFSVDFTTATTKRTICSFSIVFSSFLQHLGPGATVHWNTHSDRSLFGFSLFHLICSDSLRFSERL